MFILYVYAYCSLALTRHMRGYFGWLSAGSKLLIIDPKLHLKLK
jgi:hypothetical protein